MKSTYGGDYFCFPFHFLIYPFYYLLDLISILIFNSIFLINLNIVFSVINIWIIIVLGSHRALFTSLPYTLLRIFHSTMKKTTRIESTPK